MFVALALLCIHQSDFTGRQSANSPNAVTYKVEGKKMIISGTGEITSRGVDTALKAASQTRNTLETVEIQEGVESIGKESFQKCLYLATVQVAKSVTEVKDMAFNFDSYLISIDLPGVTSIDKYAFNKCTSLESVTFGPNLNYIGESAFADGGALKKLFIPKSVSFLGPWAFVCSTKLEELVFEENSNLARISKWCFSQLIFLTEVKLPDSITDIDEGSFYHCPALKTFHIGKNLIDIGPNALAYCTGIQDYTVDPANAVYKSVDGIIYTKENLLVQYPGGRDGKFVVPNFVKEIGSYSFASANIMELDYAPKSQLEKIKDAFVMLPNLYKVRIPASVKKITSLAFSQCKNISIVEYCSDVVIADPTIFLDNTKLGTVSVTDKYKSNTFAGRPVVKDAKCLDLPMKMIHSEKERALPKNTVIIISVSLLSVFCIVGVVIAIKVKKSKEDANINNESLLDTQQEQ